MRNQPSPITELVAGKLGSTSPPIADAGRPEAGFPAQLPVGFSWQKPISFVRLPRLLSRFGICRSTFYNRVAAGLMTSLLPLGGRAAGLPEHEADAIAAAIFAGQSEDEIKALVRKLEADRKNAASTLEAA